jgi:hypothetical protein
MRGLIVWSSLTLLVTAGPLLTEEKNGPYTIFHTVTATAGITSLIGTQ